MPGGWVGASRMPLSRPIVRAASGKFVDIPGIFDNPAAADDSAESEHRSPQWGYGFLTGVIIGAIAMNAVIKHRALGGF